MTLNELMRQGDIVNLYMGSTAAAYLLCKQDGTRSYALRSAALDLWQEVLNKKGWVRAHGLLRKLDKWDFGLWL